jgi:hypothetical protein
VVAPRALQSRAEASSQDGTSLPGMGDEGFSQEGGDPVTVWTWQIGLVIS